MSDQNDGAGGGAGGGGGGDSDRESVLSTFQAITHGQNEAECRALLESCGWNLEAAVANHFAMQEAQGSPVRRPAATAPRPPPIPTPQQPPQPQPRPRPGGAAAAAHGGLLGALVHGLGWLFQPLTRLAALATTHAALGWREERQRVLALVQAHAPETVQFYEGSYRDALLHAKEAYKFALVYFHSPHHYNSRQFCREVLGDRELVAFINEHFVAWAGDVTQPAAGVVQAALGMTDFPSFAVVGMLGAGHTVTLLQRVEGLMPAQQVRDMLDRVLTTQGMALVAARLDNEERQRERDLRVEQDQEYQQALLQEQMRLQQEEEVRRQAQLEEEQRKEEEERAQAEEARKEAEARQLEEDRKRAREEKKRNLPPPPEGGGIALAIRLPSGKRLLRAFSPENTIQMVKDFVETAEEGVEFGEFNLVATHPRRVYDQPHITLGEAGLDSQAALLIEDVLPDA